MSPSSAPDLAASPGRRAPRHVHEIDLLRLLTFASVIAVHVIGFSVPGSPVGWYGADTLLHFTRQVFFGLTSFVLVYGYLKRPRPMSEFWPRRFLLVGVPYTVWTFVYVLFGWVTSSSIGNAPKLIESFSEDLFTGNAKYHLYFLLVTMQVYLIVPALVFLARRTLRVQLLVLTAAFVLQIVILSMYAYGHNAFGPLTSYTGALFPSDIFPIVGGAVAGAHSGAFLSWIRVRRAAVLWIVIATATLALTVYAIQLAIGMSPPTAGTEMQPVEAVWSAAAGVGLLAIGAIWADKRVDGSRTSRLISWASDRSFGIYLVHPLVISVILLGTWFDTAIPGPLRFPVMYVIVIVVATVTSDLLRRTVVSMPFTGRPYAGRRFARER